MHPILFQIGSIPIHTYGFLIAVGFLAGVGLAKMLARRSGLDVEKVVDLAFWLLIVGFIGARLLFVLTRLDYFITDPVAIFKVWEGGLVFFGGPLAAMPFGLWYIRKHGMNPWKTMDAMVPGLPLGHMFGRFGCVSAGCCYGRPTEGGWGFRFESELVDAHLRGIPLHPTQLYEATGLLLLVLGLLYTYRTRRFDGQVILTYFMGYPIIRSIVEIYRGDIIRGFIIEDVLSTSQFISALVFLVALIALIMRLKQVKGSRT